MKRTLALVLAMALLLCSAAYADITVSGWSLPNNEEAQNLFDSYGSDYGFAVHYEAQPGYSDTVNKLTTMLASGDDSVDVMLIDEIMMLAFTRAGFLEPLDDVISEEDIAAFMPDYMEMFCKYEGNLYGIPASAGCHNFTVNMAKLNEAGIAVPTNEQELIDACIALTDASKNQYGLVLSLDKASHLQDNINMFALMFGGNYYDFSLEGTQKAVKFLYDLVNTHKVVSKDCLAYDTPAAQQAFIDGYAAMYFDWSTVPTLEQAGIYGPDHCTWAPIPTFETNKTMMDGWSWVVNLNSQSKEEAKEFVRRQTQINEQVLYRLPSAGLPANTLGWEDERIMSVAGNMSEMFQSYKAAGSLTPRTLSTRHSEFMDVVTGTVQRYLLDEISFEECIDTCISQTNAILEKAAD
jgi:multiple sugar transport system substrate-binding protein